MSQLAHEHDILPSKGLDRIMGQAGNGVVPCRRLSHLVRAATDGTGALSHWNAYAHESRYTFPDAGEIRLFPLVAYHLGNQMDQAANQSWFRLTTDYDAAHGAKLKRAQQTVEAMLDDVGVPVIWTKGTALANTVYPGYALRPSADLDALIPWESLATLEDLAEISGWTHKLGAGLVAGNSRYRGTEVSWDIGDDVHLDVCWMPRLPFAYDPFAMHWIADQAARQGTRYANPTWLLIEAIEHGLGANVVSPIRWVVDALWLIDRCADDIDWQMLVTMTERYRLTCAVRVGLTILRAFTDAIPEDVIRTIAAKPMSALERDELHMWVTTIDHGDEYYASRKYNLALRAPSAIYADNITSPLSKSVGLSWRVRGRIALRNLHARLIWPISKHIN